MVGLEFGHRYDAVCAKQCLGEVERLQRSPVTGIADLDEVVEVQVDEWKTCLVQGIASGLGIDSSVRVRSASFIIVSEYNGPLPLYHFDLYRLRDERDVIDAGWGEYLGRRGVIVIEWAERALSLLPKGHLKIALEITGETTRRITISNATIVNIFKEKQDIRRSESGF